MTTLLLLSLAACQKGPSIDVTVQDIWSKPVPGATVIQEGVPDRMDAGDQGHLVVQVAPGTVRLLAGAEGYVKDLQVVQVPQEPEGPIEVTMTLFPEPQGPGFYGVGQDAYVPLDSARVQAVASEMSTYVGIRDIPEARLPASKKPARFIYSSSLRPQEISRFDLKLTRLEFKEQAEVTGLTGPTQVELNLWVAGSEVPYSLKAMQSKDTYLLVTDQPLEAGAYAFHAQGLLTSTDTDTLDRLPEELRISYAFEVR